MIESDFKVGKTPHHDGQPVLPGKSAKQVKADYKKNRLAFYEDMVDSVKKGPKEEQKAFASQIAAMKRALKQREAGKVKISKVTLTGEKKKLGSLKRKNDELISEAHIVTQTQLKAKERIEEETLRRTDESEKAAFTNSSEEQMRGTGEFTAAARAPVQSYWMPRRGTSYVYPKARGTTGRYTYQSHKWTRQPRWGRSDATYEHDFFLYNYDRKTYIYNGNQPPLNCKPIVKYWTTSWPRNAKAYLDSRLTGKGWCRVGEKSFTIGAANAKALKPGTWYYTYVLGYNGNANKDKFKLYGVIGQRRPDSCYSTFCSYGIKRSRIVPRWQNADRYWSRKVPGTRSWRWSPYI